MPTGYTAGIYNGTTTDFPTFAMECARAFGALIMLRDEPIGAPIPEALAPSTQFYDEQIAIATVELARLNALSAEECEAEAQRAFDAEVERQNERLRSYDDLRARYKAMLAEVQLWTPPSRDHAEMKQFMRDQLTQSIDFDCPADPLRYYDKPERLTGEAWKAKQVAEATRRIETNAKRRAEEVERTEGRNLWLTQLRQSLAAWDQTP